MNSKGVFINKITIVKNVFMEHIADKTRISFNKELYEIEFDNGDIAYTIMKPKNAQVCFSGADFKLKEMFFTKRKVIFQDKTEL